MIVTADSNHTAPFNSFNVTDYDRKAFMVYVHFSFSKNKRADFVHKIYRPYIAGSGEHFINNTADLSLELDTYTNP